MPQHHLIRNAPLAIPSLPFEIMEEIFMLCGPKVPVINTLALFVKRRHRGRMATCIQACFKGALARHWVHPGLSRMSTAINDFLLSDMFDDYIENNRPMPLMELLGPSGFWCPHRVKMETVADLHGRPFGGVRVTYSHREYLKFHLTVPSTEDTTQLDQPQLEQS